MNLIKAAKAFLQVMFHGGSCEHPHVNLMQAPTFCPDCGYRVKIEWLFVHCRGCQAKRVPHRNFWGDIRPLYPFCRHCGHDGHKIVSKTRIDAHELIYAIGVKSTVYTEEDLPVTPPMQPFVSVENGDVFDAEVVSKSEFKGTKSAFKSAPFHWQQQQNPARYGGKSYNTPHNDNVIRFKRFS